MGHHLPGMIRAYGDRALFQRFKYRFIFAPIFLVVVCTAFFLWDLKGIVLVAFIWGVWHGMMQTYGFCRIYDAKVGSFAALTRRLDFALCGIWFATAVLLSSQRMTDTLESYYSAGGPFIPPGLLRGAQQGLFGLALAASGVFGAAGSDQARSRWCFSSPAFLFGGTATTSWQAFWLALHCSKCFTMSSTSRWFGSTIVNGLRQTARSVGLCVSCSGAVARWLEFTSA